MSDDLMKRLDVCWAMLEDEGYYTKANTVMLAKQRIEELTAENARLKDEVKMLQHSATVSYQAGIYDAELKGKADGRSE